MTAQKFATIEAPHETSLPDFSGGGSAASSRLSTPYDELHPGKVAMYQELSRRRRKTGDTPILAL